MARVTRREWYERVNGAWPAEVPALTAEEAIRAGRKLYRFALKRTFRGKVRVTSGNRRTWIRRGEMLVNPDHGWHALVHLLSHYCENGPHGGTHARMELRMIREVQRRGWLGGSLKSAPAQLKPHDLRRERYDRICSRVVSWEAKLRRAQHALKRLARSKRYYERGH